MANNFVLIKFFWVELEFFKKSHNSVNFRKKNSDFLHEASFFTYLQVVYSNMGYKKLLP